MFPKIIRTTRKGSQIENLMGKVFGRWKVIDLCKERTTGRTVYWNCLCECGKTKSVRACSLKSGNTKSCGCWHKEIVIENNTLDLKGLVFGYLTALEIVGKKRGSFLWMCFCECGNICLVTTKELRTGDTKSCGCLTDSFIANKLKKYYLEEYNAKIEYKIFKNPRTNRWLPYDIYLPKENVYMEIQGEQHYKKQSLFNARKDSFENRKYLDKIKREFAKENGVFIEIDLRKIKTPKEAISYINREFLKEDTINECFTD